MKLQFLQMSRVGFAKRRQVIAIAVDPGQSRFQHLYRLPRFAALQMVLRLPEGQLHSQLFGNRWNIRVRRVGPKNSSSQRQGQYKTAVKRNARHGSIPARKLRRVAAETMRPTG